MKAYIWKEEFQGHKIGEVVLHGDDNFIDSWTNSDMNKMLKTEIPEELSLTPIHKLTAKYVANTTKMVPTTKVVSILIPESTKIESTIVPATTRLESVLVPEMTRIETQINEQGESIEVEVIIPEHYEDKEVSVPETTLESEVIIPEHYEDQVIIEDIEVVTPEHFEITINATVIKQEQIQALKQRRDQAIADQMFLVFQTTNEASAQRQVSMYQDMLVNTSSYVGRIGLASSEQVVEAATAKLSLFREYGIFVVEKIQEYEVAKALL